MQRHAVSTAVIAVVVIVVIAVAGVGLYFATLPPATTTTTTSTSSTSTSSGSTTTSSSTSSFTATTGNNSGVSTQLNLFIQTFDNRNVGGLANFYTDSSVDTWTGNSQGLGGTYTGIGNIRILYAASIGHTNDLVVYPSKIQMVAYSPTVVNVTMQLQLNGSSTALGKISANVSAQQQWANQGGSWSIVKENWDYVSFYAQNPVEATVFPQWGLQIAGQNPNLASEHAFEWGVAPYIAAAIYISIALLGAALIIRRRRANRPT